MNTVKAGKMSALRNQNVTGFVLGALFLLIYIASPTSGSSMDAYGWGKYLEEYALAEGNFLYATSAPGAGTNPVENEPTGLPERIRNPGWWILFNPHHLLFLPITATIFRILKSFMPLVGGLAFLQAWNSIISALIIFSIHRLLSRMTQGSPYILPWCLFLGFSVTFFHYATDGTQYPTAVLMMVLASHKIFLWACRGKTRNLYVGSILLALGILFHQMMVLVVPFLLISIFLIIRNHGDISPWKKFSLILDAILLSVGLPVITYFGLIALALMPTGEFSIHGIFLYLTLYARDTSYWNFSYIDGLVINLKTFPGFYFGNRRTQDLLFVNAFFSVIVMVLPALWLTTLVAVKNMDSLKRLWVGYSVLWIFPLLIFLSVWVPGHEFYHLFLVLPMSSLSVIGAEMVRKPGFRGYIDLTIFWLWCGLGTAINLPLSFSGVTWISG